MHERISLADGRTAETLTKEKKTKKNVKPEKEFAKTCSPSKQSAFSLTFTCQNEYRKENLKK